MTIWTFASGERFYSFHIAQAFGVIVQCDDQPFQFDVLKAAQVEAGEAED